MAFAALIAAYHHAEDGENSLRALLPMAGRTLLEHQVRRALRAGASHAVVLVGSVPAALASAIDRLRRDKLPVQITKSASDAAGRFHPNEHVMLVADGLIASHACFERMAASEPQSVLAVRDVPENGDFERIDSEKRWGGLALTDPAMLRATADMLGDWDLQSTLLRRMVQRGPRYVMLGADAAIPEASPESVTLADSADVARFAGSRTLDDDAGLAESWPARFIYPPLVSFLGNSALDRAIEPVWLRAAAIALAAVAGIAFWSGWLWSGLALLIASGPISALAHGMDRARLVDPGASRSMTMLLAGAQALALLALGQFFSVETRDSGYVLAAVAAIMLVVFCERERMILRDMERDPGWLGLWLVSADAAIWLLPPLAILGWWDWWPLTVAIYAAASLWVLQDAVRGAVNPH